jgi:signal transduction histidine kinase
VTDDDGKSREALLAELVELRARVDVLEADAQRDALALSETNLRNAQRIAHLGSWDWDLATGVLDWSDENYRIFELQPGIPMDYQLFLEFVHPDDRPRLEQTVAKAFQDRERFLLDYRIILKGGIVRYLSGQGEVEFDEDDRPIRLSGTTQDLTERRQIEATLADYRDHLEELVDQRSAELLVSQQKLREADRLASLGTLAGGLAHQINNPMAVILLAAEYGRHRINDEDFREVFRKVIDDITIEAERCSTIVRSVLQFARGESTELWDEDLNSSVQRACLLTSAYAAEKHATLDLDLREPSLTVVMNPVEMEQVLVNLIRNAVESKRSGARVRATAQRIAGASGEPDTARVEIADDGDGISEADQKYIFDPFYTTRLTDGGTGLGLSLAHGIVRRHRGSLSVESIVGRGTTFRIDLPCAEIDTLIAPELA